MTTPTVYIPHVTMRRMPDATLAPVHDLSACEDYGNLSVVFDRPLAMNGDAREAMIHAFEAMREFSDDDSIVATGDPAAIAVAAMVAGIINEGRIALLRWDRWSKTYQRIVFDVPKERKSNGNR